jgi:urease accessory protein
MKRLAILIALWPVAALAHDGAGQGAPFLAGLSHPLGGADHVLAMVAVGLWAGALGGRLRWLLPAAFVAAMLAGAAMGARGLALPGVEPMILASVVLTGVAGALALRLPAGVALAAVAAFGLVHGQAHGAEGPGGAMAAYAAGFALATLALHGAGLALGHLAARPVARGLGAAAAAAGLALALD